MGVYLKCPQCENEINHDDEAFHLDQNSGDGNVLGCDNCGWVGNVYLDAKFKRIESKEDSN